MARRKQITFLGEAPLPRGLFEKWFEKWVKDNWKEGKWDPSVHKEEAIATLREDVEDIMKVAFEAGYKKARGD